MIRQSMFAIGMFALAATAAAAATEDPPFIAVQGRAEMRVVPDVFPIGVTIQDKSLEPAKAQARVEEAARAVLAQVRKQGLSDADIELGNLQVRPESRYDQNTEKETFLGTQYTRTIGLRFHTLADLKAFLAATPENKLLRLETDAFLLEDTDAARRLLFLKAVENARRTADDVAKALGKRVIRVQTVSDQPLALARGSYISAINASSVESTTILTSEQIARIPVPRDATSVRLIGDPNAPRTTEVALDEGVIKLVGVAYAIFVLGD